MTRALGNLYKMYLYSNRSTDDQLEKDEPTFAQEIASKNKEIRSEFKESTDDQQIESKTPASRPDSQDKQESHSS